MARTVLIVDDHPSFRSGARLLLESEGYEVIGEAEDGATALQAVADLDPDWVLLDVQLPDMDGFDVAARLREGGHRAAVVLTSSRECGDYGTLVARSGARGFVSKGELTGAVLAPLIA